MRSLAALAIGLIVAVAILIIGLQVRKNSDRPPTGPTGPTGPTMVLQVPLTTPLPRDSIRETKRNQQSRGSTSETGNSPGNNRAAPRRGTTPNKPRSPARTRTPARSRPDRRRPSQGGSQPAQPSNPPPAQQPPARPPVDVTVPAPGRACIEHVGGVNCP